MKHDDFFVALNDAIGSDYVLREVADLQPYITEWRGKFHRSALAVARPSSTDEVSKVVQVCTDFDIAIIPQGGNTSLVGGSVAFDPSREIILSLDRMQAIEAIDPTGNTLLVQSGAILEDIQNAAEKVDRFFPLSLGAQGSCRIGGNISTNAGGINVLKYGNTRDLILGLEVVMADGKIWNGLNALRKDNTGYDLKHLFIGGEGTLGIITRAVLKLFPAPQDRLTAWMAAETPDACLESLNSLRAHLGDDIMAAELIPAIALDQALEFVPGTRPPLLPSPPWSLLVEIGVFGNLSASQDATEAVLGELLENGTLYDGVIAQTSEQSAALWKIREAIPEAEQKAGPSIKHDVSVPVALVPELLRRGIPLLEELYPGARPVPFGHLGDGNLHFNLCAPAAAIGDAEAEQHFADASERINPVFHDLVRELGGSISAEHGIGQLKRDELARTADPVGLELMAKVKAALDPENRFNPGKILTR